jgi:addiction module RelE/StbE family toxin
MPKLEWSGPALQDLQAAGDYIAKENPEAASHMAKRVRDAVEYLRDQPNMGRAGRLSGTKELVVSGTPFIVVYWVRKGIIQVLRLLHHAQRWPE